MANTLHQLCQEFQALGHEVIVLSGLNGKQDIFTMKRRLEMKVREVSGDVYAAMDRLLGYETWRTWDPAKALVDLSKKVSPDVIVVMGGAVVPVVQAAKVTGVPTVVQVHDIEYYWHKGDFSEVGDLPVVANSEFTAKSYETDFGVKAEVVYPFMPFDGYRVESSRKYVTFINPIFRKGLILASQIASLCPELEFEFVGNLPPEQEISESGWNGELPKNVKLTGFTNDMREIYGRSKVLLVPSQWNETYGRVINEAQVSGIPALVSNRGGIPEAVADGGIILEADAPPEDWATALKNMCSDSELYKGLSNKAKLSVERDCLKKEVQMKQHVDLLAQAISAQNG